MEAMNGLHGLHILGCSQQPGPEVGIEGPFQERQSPIVTQTIRRDLREMVDLCLKHLLNPTFIY